MFEDNTREDPEPAEVTPELRVPPSTSQRAFLLWIAALVIMLDQTTKLIVEAALPLYRSWAPIPGFANIFQFTHVSNTGVAFGLFPAGSSIFAWAAFIVAIAIIAYNFGLPPGQRQLRLALGLQLGGAIGNLIDRFRLGHVTDFLDFGPWPVFNVADTSVVAGAILLAWILWQEEKRLKSVAGSVTEQDEFEVHQREIIDEPGILDEWSAN